MAPKVINVTVATIERFDSRLMPHTPWPLVHPPPSWVPKPTRRPAMTRCQRLRWRLESNASGRIQRTSHPAETSPARIINRQTISPSLGRTSPPKIPEIPKILPLNKRSTEVDVPMIAPPMRAQTICSMISRSIPIWGYLASKPLQIIAIFSPKCYHSD